MARKRLHREGIDRARFWLDPIPPVGTEVECSFNNGNDWVDASPTLEDGSTDVAIAGWESPATERPPNTYVLPLKGRYKAILRFKDDPWVLIIPSEPGEIEVY